MLEQSESMALESFQVEPGLVGGLWLVRVSARDENKAIVKHGGCMTGPHFMHRPDLLNAGSFMIPELLMGSLRFFPRR